MKDAEKLKPQHRFAPFWPQGNALMTDSSKTLRRLLPGLATSPGIAFIIFLSIFISIPQAQENPPFRLQEPDSLRDSGLLDALDTTWARQTDTLAISKEEEPTVASDTVRQDEAYRTSPPAKGTQPGHGSLSGQITAANGGAFLSDVRLILANQDKATFSDEKGHFVFPDLPPGEYGILAVHSGHDPLEKSALGVHADEDAAYVFSLQDKAVAAEKVRITAKTAQTSDAGLLMAQKNAPSVSDGISSEQMSKSPDGDAAAAVRRVTGISVGGDGLVYIRGLGERYVNVQLNGLTLSSPNPDKRVIPMDMFPTSLLEGLVASKTFTADQPAEFAGGALQLRTKDFPSGPLLSLSAKAGYSDGATGEKLWTYSGGKTDWLGFDDGTRDYPQGVPTTRFDYRSPSLGDTPEARKAAQQAILSQMPNVWTPRREKAPVDQGYSISVGNRVDLAEDRAVGWLAGGTYGIQWDSDEEFSARIRLDSNTETNSLEPNYADQAERVVDAMQVVWGGLGTGTYQWSESQKIRLMALVNRQFEDEVGRAYGKREAEADTTLLYELNNVQQTLQNYQLSGEHGFGEESDRVVEWTLSLSNADRIRPDRRESSYIIAKPDEEGYDSAFPYTNLAAGGARDRRWFISEENGLGGKVDFSLPLEFDWLTEGSKIKTGGTWFFKKRDFDMRRLTMASGRRVSSNPELRHSSYENYFGVFNGDGDTGWVTNSNEFPRDDYQVRDRQWAGYAQGELGFTDWAHLVIGARLSSAKVEGRAESPIGLLSPSERAIADCGDNDSCVFHFGYDRTGVLPSLGFIASVSERQNLRLSFGQTYSYPEYREMAPLLYFDYQQSLETVGNTQLEPTLIYNYDFRWELFPSPAELIAVSGFYKYFAQPIEVQIFNAGSNNRQIYVNAPSAYIYGAEAEARFGLSRLHPWLSAFKAIGNATWIRSEVKGKVKRALQGQAPYIANGILQWEPSQGGMQVSLLYNIIGERIAKVGVYPFPDILDSPRQSLELSASQKLGEHFKLKFTAKNITDETVRQSQGGLVIKRKGSGRSFSLGMAYAL